MSNNFQQTVNLKKKTKKISRPQRPRRRAEEIDQVYNNDKEDQVSREELSRISQPTTRQVNENLTKRIVIGLALVLVIVSVYFVFFKNKTSDNSEVVGEAEWYAVKLITGETYYGQISDTAADPVVINNVYYDYDQLNPTTLQSDSPQHSSGQAGQAGGEKKEAGNLRLVKRGQETHGPAGVMNIVRAQVVYMEPLKEDSKVLRAILDYER